MNENSLQYFYVDYMTFKNAKKEVEKNFDVFEIAMKNKSLVKSCIIQYLEENILNKDNFELQLFSCYDKFFDILKAKNK